MLPKNELKRVIVEMEKQMKEAARNLEFERAAALRDQMYELKLMLAEESQVPEWQKARLLASRNEPDDA